MVPTSLVEAERNGATFVQKLTKTDTSSSSGTAVTGGNKKANGHKEEGWFTRLLLFTGRQPIRQKHVSHISSPPMLRFMYVHEHLRAV